MTTKHVPTYYEITGYYYPKSSHIIYDLDYPYRHLHYDLIGNNEETKLKIKRLIVINRQLKQQYLGHFTGYKQLHDGEGFLYSFFQTLIQHRKIMAVVYYHAGPKECDTGILGQLNQCPNHFYTLTVSLTKSQLADFQSYDQIIRGQMQNRFPNLPVYIKRTQYNQMYVYTYYQTTSIYPARLTTQCNRLMLPSFPKGKDLSVILNAQEENGQLHFNPQIYANSLMTFGQATPDKIQELQTRVEDYFNQQVWQNKKETKLDDENCDTLTAYNINLHNLTNSINGKIDNWINSTIAIFNPIKQMPRMYINEIPQSLKDQINQLIYAN